MRKLIIIILLLITANAFGQAVLSGSKGWDGMYNIRADQFFTRCVTAGVTLTDAQKRWYNDSIFVPLSDSGLIGTTRAGDSIQALWCFATFPNGSETVCKLNLLSDSNACTNVNSVVFTDSGAVGNGSTSYLNSNCTPMYDSTIVKIYSRGLSVYSLGAREAGSFTVIGTMNSGSPYERNAIEMFTKLTSPMMAKFHTVDFGLVTMNDTDAVGYYGLSWVKNYQYRMKRGKNYLYGVEQNFAGFTPTTNVSKSYFILALRNYNDVPIYYETSCITFVAITSGLSIAKQKALGNIFNNSLKGRGYNVY